MKHYSDVSCLDGGKIEPVDIITFGSPCQDMSVAGKQQRKLMALFSVKDNEKSNLKG